MTSLRAPGALTIALAFTLLNVASPAVAASKVATPTSFCGDLLGVSVSAPALPSSDSLRNLLKAASKLPAEVRTLKATAGRLNAAASRDKSAASAMTLRSAAANVTKEVGVLNGLIAEEPNVVLIPTSSGYLSLAQRLLNANSDAAVANVYLSLSRPYVAQFCRSAKVSIR
jgi:hypothetical protein